MGRRKNGKEKEWEGERMRKNGKEKEWEGRAGHGD